MDPHSCLEANEVGDTHSNSPHPTIHGHFCQHLLGSRVLFPVLGLQRV